MGNALETQRWLYEPRKRIQNAETLETLRSEHARSRARSRWARCDTSAFRARAFLKTRVGNAGNARSETLSSGRESAENQGPAGAQGDGLDARSDSPGSCRQLHGDPGCGSSPSQSAEVGHRRVRGCSHAGHLRRDALADSGAGLGTKRHDCPTTAGGTSDKWRSSTSSSTAWWCN
jgi:hypothetical protein